MITVYLSTNKDKAYYLTSITKEQKERLYEIKESKELNIEKEFTKLSILWEIHCNGILKIGRTSEAVGSSINTYVHSFKGKDTHPTGKVGENRELHYRDYSVTFKRQKENMHLLIVCSDSISSGRSALRLMKDEYVIVWEVPIIHETHIKLQELLKDKKWYKNNL